MAWSLERARVRASREDTGMPVSLGSFAEDTETGHRALLASVGFEPVRHFFLMRRVGLDDIPDAPLPDGVEIRPVREDQWQTILDAENEAFRDHWGHREMGESAYRATFGRTGLDTSLWVVAWDGDEVAGVVQNWIWALENERLGVKRGWLEHISVRRQWRRRGTRPGDHRGLAGQSPLSWGWRRRCSAWIRRIPTAPWGWYEGLGFEVQSPAAAYRRPLVR